MVCFVLEINLCSQDLQEIIIYKAIKKAFTAINKGYFRWDYNPFQRQPPEVFYKKAVLKFCNILGKTPVLESLFNKIAGLQATIFRPAALLKRHPNTGVFLQILQNFWEHLSRITSERCLVIKRNRWNVLLSIFMFSCANLYYKHSQSNSYWMLNFKSVKITDMKSTPIWIHIISEHVNI